jgi:hypothetical protein
MMAHVRPFRCTSLGSATRYAVVAGLFVTACLLAGCAPVNEGPQMSIVPPGIGYTTTVESASVLLPSHARLRQVAYLPPFGQPGPTSIIITEVAGAVTASEVAGVRDDLVRRHTSIRYGTLEPLELAGHPGWGWTERYTTKGRVTQAGFTAVVTWDVQSYSIEVSSSDPKLIDPDRLRELAMSFSVVTQASLDGWVLIGGGLILGAIVTFLWRSQRDATRSPIDTVTRLLKR